MRAARFLAIVVLLVAIVAAALYLLRLPIAGWAVRAGMASAGLEQPQARVVALTFDGARLEGVSVGPAGGAFRFETVETDFRLPRLLSERKLDAIRVRSGRLGAALDESGRVSIAGMKQGGGNGGGGALPFDRLSVEDVTLAVSTPDGGAQGTVNADYDIAKGGAASLALSAERFAWNAIRLMGVNGEADITFSADGRATVAAKFSADAESAGVAARNVEVALTGEGGSWREAANGDVEAFVGEARIDFAAPEIEFAEARSQGFESAEPRGSVLRGDIRRAGVKGALAISFSKDSTVVRFAEETPLQVTTPEGAALTLSPQGAAALYARANMRETASFRFSLTSDGVAAAGAADIENEGGVWRIAAPVAVNEFDNGDLSLGATTLDVTASLQGDQIGVDAAVRSSVRKAAIGRLTVADAPFAGAFRIDADLTARSATVVSKNDCLRLDRVRGRLAEQDLEMTLAEVALCSTDKPLAVVTWSSDTACTVSGEISATDGRLRLGKTAAAGRPPSVRFDGAYHPSRNNTTLTGEISGGAMALNDTLNLSGAAGTFDFALDAEAMTATASLSRLRIAQHLAEEGAVPLFAPVIAAGEAALSGDQTRFSYVLTTPEARRLGSGEGSHDMAAARGETLFRFGNLTFSPLGLQPNRIFPSLKGIVDAADGDMDGEIRFGWSPSGLSSSAQFDLKKISFGGPTRAVTKTSELSGAVRLTSLLPLTTDGEQTITVKAVDLDALQLENGVIVFAFPGDDTFHLARGEFPWFGGTLGVYDATASLTGEAMIPLRADNIDLAQVLDYVKVDGLSGKGVMSGSLPLVFREGKAFIENGVFESVGGGVIRYVGVATEQAASEGGGAKVAFDILKDLRYRSMKVTVSGPLDGRLAFDMEFVGTGEVVLPKQGLNPKSQGRLPVLYKITLDAALIDLLQQALLATDVRLQIQQSVSGAGAETTGTDQ